MPLPFPHLLISIHALCEEGDFFPFDLRGVPVISIHALCEEGDRLCPMRSRFIMYFYPRPLRGGRLSRNIGESRSFEFLSTPSARRATWPSASSVAMPPDFYPRPLRGGRRVATRAFTGVADFYPRPLRGGRRRNLGAVQRHSWISIHALCEEGDALPETSTSLGVDFYPRPLRGGRPRESRRRARPA